jgi:predicted metal-dependent hydrolase
MAFRAEHREESCAKYADLQKNHKDVTLEIDEVGKVLFVASRRARRLSISIRPPGNVRVVIPKGTSFATAREFVLAKSDVIRKHLDKFKRMERRYHGLLEESKTVDKTQAGRQLKNRLAALAKIHGYSYGRVFIRNQKTRWGSCSGKNNINLNLYLVLLPAPIRDYVLLHELVHTRIKNHQKAFWEELSRIVPNAKQLDKKLRTYKIGFLQER